MLSLFLSLGASYRICPNKIPFREDLYYEKTVKGEHWSYFTIKLNSTQFFMYLNITATGNTSVYIGRNNRCPYKNDKPFVRLGQNTQTYLRAWKTSTETFPIGIYAEEESKVRITIDPIDFDFDVEKYLKLLLKIVVPLFIVVQFLRGFIDFGSLFKRSSKKQKNKKQKKSHKK